MNWSPTKASSWLKQYADDLASDAYKAGGDDLLYACAGAAYYAVLHGVGYNTKQEFSDFLQKHIGLDEDYIKEAIEEINRNVNSDN